jgi:hypothetical protein
MGDSKNAAISGVDTYKVGLNFLIFTLTPFISDPIYLEMAGDRTSSMVDQIPSILEEETASRRTRR